MARRKRSVKSTRPTPRREPRAGLLESLRDGMEEHNSTLANRAREYYSAVREFAWNSDRNILLCAVKGSQTRPYSVSLAYEDSLGEFDIAWCNCPYSGEMSLCKHTYAAMHILYQRLSDKLDPIGEELFHLGNEKAAWKKVLRDLDGLLDSWQHRDHAAQMERSSPSRTRLTWRVGVISSYNGVEVQATPYEQKSRKNGGWTVGRRLGWDGLRSNPDLASTPMDRQILQLAVQAELNDLSHGYYQAGSFSTYGEAIPSTHDTFKQLIGHPLVFWEEDPKSPVTVRPGVFGLGVSAKPEGLQLEVQIDGHAPHDGQQRIMVENDESEAIVVLDKASGEIIFAPLEHGSSHFLQKLEQAKAAIPLDKQEDLLSRLSKVEMKIPVTLPPELLGGSRSAEQSLILRLTPIDPAGVYAELRVQPAPDGPLFEPGAGPAILTTVENDRRVAVERDLSDEVAKGEQLMEDLYLTDVPTERKWTWRLEQDEVALDLISLAQDRADQEDGNLLVLWPEGAKISVSREIGPQALKVEIEDRKDWFGLKGMIEIDGEQVPLSSLLAAVKNGSCYVAIGKQKWVRIAQTFKDRLAQLADVVHPTRSGLEIDTTAAFVAGDLLGSDALVKASKRWREVLKRLDETVELCPDPPITLTAELRDYQLEGYRWLKRLATWGVGGCLADDMGLGKTVQTLALLIDRMEEGPSLVVAPTSVAFNWVRETDRFAPTLKPTLYRETDRDEVLSQLGEGDVLVVSYGLLQRDAEKLASVAWGTLVLDEAQKIKNSQTKTAQAVRGLDAKWRLSLTGTPVENHLGELWSMFRAISPGLLGSWERFRERFAEPIERKKDVSRRHALARTVRPFILRRTKSEVLTELPQRTETQLTAELSPQERKLYDDARLSAIAKLAGSVAQGGSNGKGKPADPRFEVLAALTRLRQLACHPQLVDAAWKESSAKLDLFLDVVEELREGKHRALVFSQFTQHLALLRKALDERGISYRYLDGSTPAKQRELEVDAFQRGDGELFLISLKAGGTGLNLTAADYVIHMDPWWNPAVEDQATDRAHRMGQTRPVTVYRLVAKDTIEEQILALHADKRNLVAGVLDGADQAGKLSTEELIALIRDQAGPDLGENQSESAAKPKQAAAVNGKRTTRRDAASAGPKPATKKRKTRRTKSSK